jgi:CBS domain containing-hemolysin-like protein
MASGDPLRVGLVLLILLGNAFFVTAEYALVTARRSHLAELAERGDRRAVAALDLTGTPLRFVSTVQIGVTFFSILLGAVGTPLLEQLFAPALATTLAYLTAFAVLTAMHVVLGELVPKAVALARREQIALRIARPLRVFSLLVWPLVWLLDGAATLLTRPFGVALSPAGVAVETEADIRLLVAEAEEAGVIEEAEEEMLYKVFDFADKEVRLVMVARPDIDAIPVDCTPNRCLAEMASTRHTRYPVYRTSLDDLVGVLNVHDLLSAMVERRLDAVRIVDLVRPAYVVPETKNLAALLAEFRRNHQQMAIVVDEYGSVQGLATLEDLLEQIVGEIADEYELPDESLVATGEGAFLVHGTFPIDDFNEQLGQRLPLEDYRTLAGFVFGRLGRAPEKGDEVVWNGLRFRVVKTEGARIELLEVALAAGASSA